MDIIDVYYGTHSHENMKEAILEWMNTREQNRSARQIIHAPCCRNETAIETEP